MENATVLELHNSPDHSRIRSHFPCRTADRFHDCSNRKQTEAPRRYSCIELGGSSWNENTQTMLDQAADFLCEIKERQCKSYTK